MSVISFRLSESLHKKEGISINQLISSALAEKITAHMTVEYLQERASRGSKSRFERVLSNVKDVGPQAEDRIWKFTKPKKYALGVFAKAPRPYAT